MTAQKEQSSTKNGVSFINDAVNYLLDTIGQTVISPWDGHLLCTTHGFT
jgi:hypothetical protein